MSEQRQPQQPRDDVVARWFAPRPWRVVDHPRSAMFAVKDGKGFLLASVQYDHLVLDPAVLEATNRGAHLAQAIAGLPELMQAAAAVFDHLGADPALTPGAELERLRRALWVCEGKLPAPGLTLSPDSAPGASPVPE